MKQFFSENINSMTFTFSFIILLNAFFGFFKNVHGDYITDFIMGLALLILVLFILAHIITYINFQSSTVYHVVHLSSQLAAFFTITIVTNLIALNMSSLLTNLFVFVLLYYLNYRMEKHRIHQLADAINQHLTK